MMNQSIVQYPKTDKTMEKFKGQLHQSKTRQSQSCQSPLRNNSLGKSHVRQPARPDSSAHTYSLIRSEPSFRPDSLARPDSLIRPDSSAHTYSLIRSEPSFRPDSLARPDSSIRLEPSFRADSLARRHHSWFEFAVIAAATILLLMVSGCNILDDSDAPVVLIVDLAPSTAGSVEIRELDAERKQFEIIAVSNENWRFARWSGAIEASDNPLIVTITEQTRIVAQFELSGSDFQVELQFDNGHSETNLVFGAVPGSTDGFDSQWDLESPPPPPEETLHAWFQAGERQLLRDFRNPFTTAIEWQMKLQPGDTDMVHLSWTMSQESFSGSLLLWDTRGALSVDMTEESEVKLPADPSADYRITYKLQL